MAGQCLWQVVCDERDENDDQWAEIVEKRALTILEGKSLHCLSLR